MWPEKCNINEVICHGVVISDDARIISGSLILYKLPLVRSFKALTIPHNRRHICTENVSANTSEIISVE